MLQVPAGNVLDASDSVSSYVSYLDYSVRHVLLMPSIFSESYKFLSPSSLGFPKLQLEGNEGDLQFQLSVHLKTDQKSLFLLPSASKSLLMKSKPAQGMIYNTVVEYP